MNISSIFIFLSFIFVDDELWNNKSPFIWYDPRIAFFSIFLIKSLGCLTLQIYDKTEVFLYSCWLQPQLACCCNLVLYFGCLLPGINMALSFYLLQHLCLRLCHKSWWAQSWWPAVVNALILRKRMYGYMKHRQQILSLYI